MTIPKIVKVGPYVYDVISDENVANEGACFGSTHNDHLKIFIDPNKPEQKQKQTFVHELLHACMFVAGLTYRFQDDDKSRRPTEEDVCRDLSTVLYQVVMDNPEVFK